MKRKSLAFALTAMLTWSVVVCGNNSSSSVVKAASQKEVSVLAGDETGTQPEINPIEEAMKNMQSVNSMEAQMVMDMDIAVAFNGREEKLETTTAMNMVCFANPLKFKVDMIMDMGDLGSTVMYMYGEPAEDGTYNLYMYDGEDWFVDTEDASILAQYDAQSSMVNYIGDASVYKLEGEEQVNGANAYKYSYVMTGEEMKEALKSSGALDSAGLGVAETQLDSMLEGLSGITEYVWVDAASLYPIKYEMDMTEVMDMMMANIFASYGEQMKGFSTNVSEFKMVMVCSNFNHATDFTIPEDAKN